jgi:hypothetical protein
MANEIVPYQMSKALDHIHRLRALIEWRCTRDDIRTIHEPLKADITGLRAAVDALERAFEVEKERANGTGPVSERGNRL